MSESVSFLNKDFSAKDVSNSGFAKKLNEKGITGLSNSQKQKVYEIFSKYNGNASKALGAIRMGGALGPGFNVDKIRKALGARYDYSGYRKEQAALRKSQLNIAPVQSSSAKIDAVPHVPLSYRQTNVRLDNNDLIKKSD